MVTLRKLCVTKDHPAIREVDAWVSVADGRLTGVQSPVAQKKVSALKYTHAPHNNVSINDGTHIRWWSHNNIIYII